MKIKQNIRIDKIEEDILGLQKATNLACSYSHIGLETTTVGEALSALLKHLKLDLEFVSEKPSTVKLVKRSPK